jgi:hypothetical protein
MEPQIQRWSAKRKVELLLSLIITAVVRRKAKSKPNGWQVRRKPQGKRPRAFRARWTTGTL